VDFYKPVEAAVQFYGAGSASAPSANDFTSSTPAISSTPRVSPYDDEALYGNLLASMDAAQSSAAYGGATVNLTA